MIFTGTEAWIDALGYLRQKDYIADKEGYRILKSKTIFVGKDTPIKVTHYLNIYFVSSLTYYSDEFLGGNFKWTSELEIQ